MEHREGHQSWMLVSCGRLLVHLSSTKGHISQTGATGSVERATNVADKTSEQFHHRVPMGHLLNGREDKGPHKSDRGHMEHGEGHPS